MSRSPWRPLTSPSTSAKSLAAHAVHHPAELAVLFRWLPLVHPVMFPGHDAPPACLDISPQGRFLVADMIAWGGANSDPWPGPQSVSIGGSPARGPRRSIPSQSSSLGVGSTQSRKGTDANDASMMVRPLPQMQCQFDSLRSTLCGCQARAVRLERERAPLVVRHEDP